MSMGGVGGMGGGGGGSRSHVVQKAAKTVKNKSNNSGRTYTSRFRGVHQTFPTKRWEAQFRRNGKPTSLGKEALSLIEYGDHLLVRCVLLDCHNDYPLLQ